MGDEESSKRFRNFAIAFLKEAREDTATAKDLLERKRYSRVVYFSQQCAEKSIKSLLEMEKIFVAKHDLSTFFVKFIYSNKAYLGFKKELERILEIIDYFEGEWSRTRYPKEKEGKVVTPTEIYEFEDATGSIEKAEEILSLITKILSEKFSLRI